MKPRSLKAAKSGVIILFAAALIYGGVKFWGGDKKKSPADFGERAQTVRVETVKLATVPVYLNALGTVNAAETVLVKSRVDGQLTALYFTEGQMVTQGDLLAEIDIRPFEAKRMQAQGILERDQALLKDARQDLARFKKLIKEQSVSPQQLQAQEALVGQYSGLVKSDEAVLADAELQLSYCRISAPISGRLGLKQIDVGNMVKTNDTQGIVLITSTSPAHVVFTLVEKHIPEVRAAMVENAVLDVEAWDQDNKKLLGTGHLLSLDNQIDTATGTVKAKAFFSNKANELFPNQFVNTRLRVKTLENVLLLPSAAVQRNNDGYFVYKVTNGTVAQVSIHPVFSTDTGAVIDSGLGLDDIVVTDGVDRLSSGSKVTYSNSTSSLAD